jgi:hypothetical protein
MGSRDRLLDRRIHTPFVSATWPYPYDSYKGFITGNIKGLVFLLCIIVCCILQVHLHWLFTWCDV